jgi:hypothetical protein
LSIEGLRCVTPKSSASKLSLNLRLLLLLLLLHLCLLLLLLLLLLLHLREGVGTLPLLRAKGLLLLGKTHSSGLLRDLEVRLLLETGLLRELLHLWLGHRLLIVLD